MQLMQIVLHISVIVFCYTMPSCDIFFIVVLDRSGEHRRAVFGLGVTVQTNGKTKQ